MTLLSMNELTTFRWSLEEDVEHYQHAGYQSIGVWRQKLADGEEDRGIDLLAASGLSVSNVLSAADLPAVTAAHLMRALRCRAGDSASGRANAGCLVVYSGGRNNHTYRHAGRLLRTALDELLPLCGNLRSAAGT